jgi:hypothetical protein
MGNHSWEIHNKGIELPSITITHEPQSEHLCEIMLCENDGTYRGGNGSGIQLVVEPIIQHFPQYPGGL